MVWPALIAGGAALAGAALSYKGGQEANAASAREAQLNREFQERMSREAHQRQVKDLRAAGLNPILSATGGSGASTPGGSMAQQRDVMTPAVSTAMQARMNSEMVKNARSQNRLIRNQADQMEWLSDKTEAEANTARSVQEMYSLDAQVRSERFHGDMADARTYNALPEWARDAKYYGQYLGPVGGLAGTAKGIVNKFGFGKPKLRAR